jgi:hypothetical protein
MIQPTTLIPIPYQELTWEQLPAHAFHEAGHAVGATTPSTRLASVRMARGPTRT